MCIFVYIMMHFYVLFCLSTLDIVLQALVIYFLSPLHHEMESARNLANPYAIKFSARGSVYYAFLYAQVHADTVKFINPILELNLVTQRVHPYPSIVSHLIAKKHCYTCRMNLAIWHLSAPLMMLFSLYIQAVTLPIQGFFNAIAYGWTRDDFINAISLKLEEEHDNMVDNDSNLPPEEMEESVSSSVCSDKFQNTIYPTSGESDGEM